MERGPGGSETCGCIDGVPITPEAYSKMEAASRVDFTEHASFQDTQAWAHAMGIISAEEAQVVYAALGVVGDERNGGWASGTDLATKNLVSNLVPQKQSTSSTLVLVRLTGNLFIAFSKKVAQ